MLNKVIVCMPEYLEGGCDNAVRVLIKLAAFLVLEEKGNEITMMVTEEMLEALLELNNINALIMEEV